MGRKVGSLKRAGGTSPSQNVKDASAPDRFFKFRCRKMGRRCGAKRVFKSKCTKHLSGGLLTEGQMSKNCTLLLARSKFPSQNLQNTPGPTIFCRSDVEKWHGVVARSKFPSQNLQNHAGADHFLKFRCQKTARCCGAKQISKSKC